jgi:glycosyltransferase involved in cell wall biosynthesis
MLPLTHQRIIELADHWVRLGIINDYEIIYVNDGSTDGTLDLLSTFCTIHTWVKLLSLSRNFGHQAALLAGIHQASGDAIVTIDADLQDPPEVIAEMIQCCQAGHDIVYGVRSERSSDGFFKKTSATLFYKFMKFMGVDIIEQHADYRLFTQRVKSDLDLFPERNIFLRGIFSSLGYSTCIVKYERQARAAGATKYPLTRMIRLALDGITSFSVFPLRLSSLLGLSMVLLSTVLGGWVSFKFLQGDVIPGWASTVLPLAIFSGIQFIILGMIGEYVGKIYIETKRRPIYIIEKKINL